MRVLSTADGTAGNGWLQGLDVRAKMLVCILASTLTVCLSSIYAQLILFVFSFCYLLSLKRPKIIVISYVGTAVIMAISVAMVFLLSRFIPGLLKGMNFQNLSIPFLRILISLNVIVPLAFSTNIQSILHALQKMRLPFCIYLPAAVIIRFIPTFANDIKQVWESLKIRGWSLNPIICTLHPIITTRLLLTPILFRALKTSDELGIAAELKGLKGGYRSGTSLKSGWRRTEWILTGLCVAVTVLAIAGQILTPETMTGRIH